MPHKLAVLVSDAEPSKSVQDLLSEISVQQQEQSKRKFRNFGIGGKSRKFQCYETDRPAPDWFKEKWIRRTQEILDSDKCPRKYSGEADWSVVEYKVASQTLYGYKNRDRDKQADVAGWISEILSEQAENSGKPKPEDYANRTIHKIAQDLELEITQTQQETTPKLPDLEPEEEEIADEELAFIR